MKQRMEVIRQESAKEALSAAVVKRTDEQESTDVDLSDVDRFLNDKFK
jgi:hypothetical protein